MAYKVLIVDDSKLARMSVAKVLGALRPDWERTEATNADEALALVRQQPIDIALLDFNMPGRDGLSLAAELRQTRPDMPVALISANVQTEVVTRAEEVGAQFLPKPLTQQALAAFLVDAERRLTAEGR
jgi:CheY-like chemotaxis protein